MSYSLIRESFPCARKKHRCIWCGESIDPGEKHRHERSSNDGAFQDFRWHLECDEEKKEDFRRGGDEEFIAHSNERPLAAQVASEHSTMEVSRG